MNAYYSGYQRSGQARVHIVRATPVRRHRSSMWSGASVSTQSWCGVFATNTPASPKVPVDPAQPLGPGLSWCGPCLGRAAEHANCWSPWRPCSSRRRPTVAERIQRRRTNGWRMPEGAVYVGRPTIWGNPFAVGKPVERASSLWPYLTQAIYGIGSDFPALAGLTTIRPYQVQTVVDAYAWWLYEQPGLMVSLGDLAGKDLICWCPLGRPCHADVLLDIANGGDRG